LEAQLLASLSSVESAKDTRSWLEKKGWMLSSEPYSKNKIAEILFSATLSFKLPPGANTAIWSTAYLIRDLADEDLTSSVSDKIMDKIAIGLRDSINKLSDSLDSAKNFLDAMSQQQASELLSLQDSIKQHSDLAKSLVDSSEKLTQAPITRGLSYHLQTLLPPKGSIPHLYSTPTTPPWLPPESSSESCIHIAMSQPSASKALMDTFQFSTFTMKLLTMIPFCV
jgi:hypothetical protein